MWERKTLRGQSNNTIINFLQNKKPETQVKLVNN